MKKDRDIEKGYTTKQMVAKLRRLADCLEKEAINLKRDIFVHFDSMIIPQSSKIKRLLTD